MQGSFSAMDFIILLVVAAFIISRFVSHNLPKDNKSNNKAKIANIVSFPDVKPTPKVKPVKVDKNLSGLDQLKSVDKSFKEKEFLEGAQSAYFMYVEAYNARDEESLDALLAPKILDEVMDDIESLQESGKQRLYKVEEIKNAEIVDVKLHGRTAIVDVKYTVSQKESILKEGSSVSAIRSQAKEVSCIWTWARNVDSDDLNWELESTSLIS